MTSQRDELAAIYVETLNKGHGRIDRPTQGQRAADAILAAGYRKIFDGDCGLSNVADPTDREAAEAWMRFSNIVMSNEHNGIEAMKKMLTEFGYRKETP